MGLVPVSTCPTAAGEVLLSFLQPTQTFFENQASPQKLPVNGTRIHLHISWGHGVRGEDRTRILGSNTASAMNQLYDFNLVFIFSSLNFLIRKTEIGGFVS